MLLMGEWSAWGECSKSCDEGTKERFREQSNDADSRYTDIKTCNKRDCPSQYY